MAVTFSGMALVGHIIGTFCIHISSGTTPVGNTGSIIFAITVVTFQNSGHMTHWLDKRYGGSQQ